MKAERAESFEYGPSKAGVFAALAGGVIFGALAAHLFDDADKAGGTLFILGALLLFGAGIWALLGPVVVLSDEGIQLRSGLSTLHLAWSEVQTCAATKNLRRGITQRNLEVETPDHFVVLPDWLLNGADQLEDLVTHAAELRTH